MLTLLAVRNLGVVEAAELELPGGLIALTGETGAGKTLLVEAIGLLLGARSRGDLVGPEGERAVIRAIVEFDGVEVVVEREMSREGRSRARVDGELVAVNQLAEVVGRAVQVVAQHQAVLVTSPDAQRSLLDRAGRVDVGAWLAARRRLGELDEQLREHERRIEEAERARALLGYELQELEAAELADPHEDDELLVRIERLAAAGELRRMLAELRREFVGSGGLLERASVIARSLASAFPELAGRLEALAAEGADIAEEARRAFESLEEDPATLERLQARLAQLAALKRRFGPTLEDVLAARDERRARLATLERASEDLATLEVARAEAAAELERRRAELRAARERAAQTLERHLHQAFGELDLAHARFAVALEGPDASPAFLFSGSPDLEVAPLGRAASGGELSRLVLAMAELLGEGSETLVLDEVDAGLGGQAALGVARRLLRLARHRQVLVVTHTASIAAAADAHAVVRKQVDGGKVRTEVRMVQGQERIEELARLLSGQPAAAIAQEHARSLLASMAGVRTEGGPASGPDRL